VLALLAAEKRDGILLLVHKGKVATAYLRDGMVVRVEVPDPHQNKPSLERLFHILDWTDGRFEFSIAEVSDPDTVNMPVAEALLKHAQLQDEPEPTRP